MSHFLIVDDDAAVARTLGRMLAVGGHQSTAVHSAEEGLRAAVGALPDAILLDLRMPVLGGVEFLRRILEDPLLAEIAALGATVHYKPLWLEEVIALAEALTGAKG